MTGILENPPGVGHNQPEAEGAEKEKRRGIVGVFATQEFGGTDGHKYVNGVLDKAAGDLRREETGAARAARS